MSTIRNTKREMVEKTQLSQTSSFHLFFIPMIFVLIFPKSPLLFHLIFHFDSSSLILSLIYLCFSHLGDLVVAHSSSWICWQMSVVLFDCLLLCTFFLVYFIFPKKHTSHLSHCICMDTERNNPSRLCCQKYCPWRKKNTDFLQKILCQIIFSLKIGIEMSVRCDSFPDMKKLTWKTFQKVFRTSYHSRNKNLYCTLKQPNSNTKMEETGGQWNELKENTQDLKKFFRRIFKISNL